jgi:hypothetical protein
MFHELVHKETLYKGSMRTMNVEENCAFAYTFLRLLIKFIFKIFK